MTTIRSHVTPEGYLSLYLPKHPMASARGYVLEHRVVMAEHVGRSLTSREYVHHVNEDKLDNRIENLELCSSQREHFRKHWADRTHCVQGHELTPENTYIRRDGRGWRVCKRCAYLRNKARTEKRIASGLTAHGKERVVERTYITAPGLRAARLVLASRPKATHCKRGHEFTPENTYMTTKGRHCKECQRQHTRRYRAARKAVAS